MWCAAYTVTRLAPIDAAAGHPSATRGPGPVGRGRVPAADAGRASCRSTGALVAPVNDRTSAGPAAPDRRAPHRGDKDPMQTGSRSRGAEPVGRSASVLARGLLPVLGALVLLLAFAVAPP